MVLTTSARWLPFVAVRDVARHETLFFSFFLFDTSKQARCVHPVLSQCWTSVADGGPTFIQHWMGVACLLGCIITLAAHVFYYHCYETALA